MNKKIKIGALAIAVALFGAACTSDEASTSSEGDTSSTVEGETSTTVEGEEGAESTESTEAASDLPASVVDIAISSPDHTIFVQAVTAAGLVDALSDPEATLTVFAPTDAAFEAYITEAGITAEELLANEELAAILQGHVIGSVINAEAAIAADGTEVETLAGTSVAVAVDGEAVSVGGANVSTVDLEAANGIVHVIDTVIA